MEAWAEAKTLVERLLEYMGYSPKANRKQCTGSPHINRGRQSWYIERVKRLFIAFEVSQSYIRGITIKTGLDVRAFLPDMRYEKEVAVSDEEMATLDLEQCIACPNWNYVTKPCRAPPGYNGGRKENWRM